MFFEDLPVKDPSAESMSFLDSFEEEKAPDTLYESREAELHYSDKQPHVSVSYFPCTAYPLLAGEHCAWWSLRDPG